MPSPKPPRARHPALTFFERSAEWATNFVSGHWGTLTALILFLVGAIVFATMDGSPTASMLEKFMTMFSLVLLFLLQRAQAKDTLTLQLKLNELISSHDNANSEMINIEELSEDQVKELHEQFKGIEKIPEKENMTRS